MCVRVYVIHSLDSRHHHMNCRWVLCYCYKWLLECTQNVHIALLSLALNTFNMRRAQLRNAKEIILVCIWKMYSKKKENALSTLFIYKILLDQRKSFFYFSWWFYEAIHCALTYIRHIYEAPKCNFQDELRLHYPQCTWITHLKCPFLLSTYRHIFILRSIYRKYINNVATK